MFIIVKKGSAGKHRHAPESISVQKSVISFGLDIIESFMETGEYVEIYKDKEGSRVGFRGTDNVLTGFKLMDDARKTGTKCYCRRINNNSKILHDVPFGRYEAYKEDDMWIIKVEYKDEEE